MERKGLNMDLKDNNRPQTDWELMDDYYQSPQNQQEFRLEDFMDDNTAATTVSGNSSPEQTQQFQKICQDVHNVLILGKDGRTIQEISFELNLDPQYVYDIQVSAQGFREDDEIAVAHLIEMSL